VIVWDYILWEEFEDTIGGKQNESVYRRRIDNIITKWRSTKGYNPGKISILNGVHELF
jgi:hypothetical protein